MQPTLLVQSGDGQPWRMPEVTPYNDEGHLQTLLQGAPELIPSVGSSRSVVMVHELEVRYGFADLVGVSPTGAITVVECKLAGNADMRRTIVGQLFAYAAGLTEMTYEQFDEAWQAPLKPFNMGQAAWEARRRPPLIEDVAAAVQEHGLEWDREGFAAAVAENLAKGAFTLVFAVDAITDELRAIVGYLSAHTAPNVNILGLEIGYLEAGETRVLVPRVYGQEMAQLKVAATRRPAADAAAPDEATFMAKLQETVGDWAPPLTRAILEWADREHLEVWYGNGSRFGTFYVGMRDPAGNRRSLLGCWTSGAIEVQFNQILYLPPFDALDARLEVLKKLAKIEQKTRPDRHASSWPTVDVKILQAPANLTAFLALFSEVVARASSRP